MARNIVAYPFVSIIVPMRNEEKNVIECIESLVSLTYPTFEIVVGNDTSTDNTSLLLTEAEYKHSSLRVITIPPIRNRWTGKTWAVYNLIQEARGELILVVDADVRHSPESLTHSVEHLLQTKSDLLVRFPYPVVRSVGEWQTLFLFFAMRFSAWFSSDFCRQREAIAKEEYVLLTKKCYEELGTYEAFKSDYPLLLAFLSRAFKENKKVSIIDDDAQEITATAYAGFRGTWKGVAERINFRHIGFFSFFGIFIVTSFAIDGVFKMLAGVPGGVVSYVLFALLFSMYLRQSRQPVYIGIVAPFLGITFLISSLYSVIRTAMKSSLHWKGRTIQTQ